MGTAFVAHKQEKRGDIHRVYRKPVLEVSAFLLRGEALSSGCISILFSLEEKESKEFVWLPDLGGGKESPGLCLNEQKKKKVELMRFKKNNKSRCEIQLTQADVLH